MKYCAVIKSYNSSEQIGVYDTKDECIERLVEYARGCMGDCDSEDDCRYGLTVRGYYLLGYSSTYVCIKEKVG